MEEITFKKHHKKSGIYMLKWPETEYIYIGQSLNIHSRVYGHLRKIKKGIHENKKINDVSKKYGIPKCYLVCFCSREI